jgi:hypothetical protein
MNTPRKDPDDSSRRQKCERWGVAYAFDPGEPAVPRRIYPHRIHETLRQASAPPLPQAVMLNGLPAWKAIPAPLLILNSR